MIKFVDFIIKILTVSMAALKAEDENRINMQI